MIYPIAEIFHSIQGEGVHTGVRMLFVRLAGCNVGEYCAEPEPELVLATRQNDLKLLTTKKHSICTAVSGQQFLCDTDYHSYEKHSEDALVGMLEGEAHVCITGGEPFLHNLTPLVLAFQARGVMVHIETSGTKQIRFPKDADLDFPRTGLVRKQLLWITCSPKKGLLPETIADINEIKYLVSPTTTEADVQKFLEDYGPMVTMPVYLQPINGVDDCSDDSLDRCLELLKKFPLLRLSAQLHKYLHQR